MNYAYDPGRQPGLYKSTDGGRTWLLILGSPYSQGILRVIRPTISAASPDKIYAFVNGYGMPPGSWDLRAMVSTNGGQTWTNYGTGGMLTVFNVLVAYADAADSNIVYAGGA